VDSAEEIRAAAEALVDSAEEIRAAAAPRVTGDGIELRAVGP